ncbi:MAG: hypothetical protein OEV44_08415 [Spirochaetota bacterium]|nr:hypothetical protein [Spirochaetota bacterium]
MLTIFKELIKKNEQENLNQEKIVKIICETFNGHVLSIDELKETYKNMTFNLLNKGEIINREILKGKLGYDFWDWFYFEWNDCLRKESDGFTNYY